MTTLRLGIDIGSTSIKFVVLDENAKIIYKNYERHEIYHTFHLKKPNSIGLNNIALYSVKDDETNEVKEYYIEGEYVLCKENIRISIYTFFSL